MNTEEKLIADYMGLKPIITYAATGDTCGYWVNPVTHERWEDVNTPPPFSSSWNWLMPVCVKLKLDYISTDINIAFPLVVKEIKSLSIKDYALYVKYITTDGKEIRQIPISNKVEESSAVRTLAMDELIGIVERAWIVNDETAKAEGFNEALTYIKYKAQSLRSKELENIKSAFDSGDCCSVDDGIGGSYQKFKDEEDYIKQTYKI